MKKLSSILVFTLLIVSHLFGQGQLLTINSLTIPATPTNLVATPFSAMEVHLTWNDVSNEDKYIVYLRINNVWSMIDTTAINICSYKHQNLNSQTNYCYAVAAYDSGNYSLLSDMACASTFVGIKEQTKNKINLLLSPNPVTDLLTIAYQGTNELLKVNIYDMKGCMVYSQNTNSDKTSIDLSFLNKGIYFLNVQGSTVNLNKKLIKE